MTTQFQTNKLNGATPRAKAIDRRGLYKAAGAAGLLAGMVLLVGMISLIVSVLQPEASTSGWLSFQNLWLIVIFKLHAGFNGVDIGRLHVLNSLDIALLATVGILFTGLYSALNRTSKVWSIIASVQPFLGMVIFIASMNAGRSGVMGATLVISAVMLRSKTFNKITAALGMISSLFLLVGDFSTGVLPPSAILAILVGIGYALLTIWFFIVAQRLLQLGEKKMQI